MTHYQIIPTKLGDLLLYANDTHLTGIYFVGQKYMPIIAADWTLDPAHPVLKQAAGEVDEYFAGQRQVFSVPTHFGGTPFQHHVWEQIAAVPFGQTITYGELAKRVGTTNAVRAAGAATRPDPISIIVPCHRILGKDGTLTGYAGGLDRKRHLLDLERSIAGFTLDPTT